MRENYSLAQVLQWVWARLLSDGSSDGAILTGSGGRPAGVIWLLGGGTRFKFNLKQIIWFGDDEFRFNEDAVFGIDILLKCGHNIMVYEARWLGAMRGQPHFVLISELNGWWFCFSWSERVYRDTRILRDYLSQSRADCYEKPHSELIPLLAESRNEVTC